jgi:hypothetical protein
MATPLEVVTTAPAPAAGPACPLPPQEGTKQLNAKSKIQNAKLTDLGFWILDFGFWITRPRTLSAKAASACSRKSGCALIARSKRDNELWIALTLTMPNPKSKIQNHFAGGSQS